MEIIFSHPNYLWSFISVPILVVLHFLSIRYTSRKALKFANFPAIEKATGDKLTSKNTTVLISRIIIVILAILSAAGSTLWYTTTSTASDYILVIDASSSMLADDYSPNRLEAAKSSAVLFLDFIPRSTNIGIVSFAGTSFVDLQLSNDRDAIKNAITNIEAKRVGGTDIGEAIITASNLLSSSANSKVVILLTDGRTNVGQVIDEAIEYANKNKITVNTIGIGTIAGGDIAEGITLTLDEATLERISLSTSGTYIRAEDNQELTQAYENMAELTLKKVPINLSIIFLVIVIILLFVEWGLTNTKYRIFP